jgi:LAO/AO transport system kinase
MDTAQLLSRLHAGDTRAIARAISLVEDQEDASSAIMEGLDRTRLAEVLVVGITGPPGAGKSTLTASLVKSLRSQNIRVGIIAVDPSSPLTGGALLGDRIRMMEHTLDSDVVVRSMATRGRLGGLCASAGAAVRILAASGCRVILIETVGIGQSEMDIVSLADITMMVLAPGFGDDIQAMKAGILEVVDLLVINKADQPGAQKLLLDLGKETANSDRVLQTIASEHQGVDLLLERIFALEESLRDQDELVKRRHRSHRSETLDWALELLKPHLQKQLKTETVTHQDPRQAASIIIDQITRNNMNSDEQHK